VQQEPVHKDNKGFRRIIREKIAFSWSLDEKSHIYWIKQIEDYLLPTLIYNFYSQNKIKDFSAYLDKVDLQEKNFRQISNAIEGYLAMGEAYPLNINGKILGDAHPGGVTKCFSNKVIKYSKYPDYGELLFSLSALIFPDHDNFFPKIIKKGNSFEREYIQTNLKTKKIEDVQEYYFNLGKILPFLLILRAIDINAENMIINLPYPVFFDMETIFSGKLDGESDEYGIKNTGIVKIGNNDSSVLTGGLTEHASLLKPLICGDQYKPYIGWRTQSKGIYENIPVLNEVKAHPIKYVENLYEGYKKSVRKILEKKNEIIQIVNQSKSITRVIIRPTRMYRLFVLKSCYPQIYTKQTRESYLKESLENCGYIHQLKIGNLIENEVLAMLDFQIPVYYTKIKEKGVFSASGEVVAKWNESPYEVWKSYIEVADDEYFSNQWGIIKDSIG